MRWRSASVMVTSRSGMGSSLGVWLAIRWYRAEGEVPLIDNTNRPDTPACAPDSVLQRWGLWQKSGGVEQRAGVGQCKLAIMVGESRFVLSFFTFFPSSQGWG